MAPDRPATVLVVDDDPQVLDIYAKLIEDSYTVYRANGGPEALDVISDDVDVVLIDRRMPSMSGGEVLEAIREEGYSCRVAMVTAVNPELEVFDMEIDDYLVKPVTKSKLRDAIDSLLEWDEYDSHLREYLEVAKKIEILERVHQREVLEGREEYQRLRERLSSLQTEANADQTDIAQEMLSTISDRDLDRLSTGSDGDLQYPVE